MEVDHYSEGQDSAKVVDEVKERENINENVSTQKEQDVFTVDELLNDFNEFPICFKIKYIMTVYNWDDDQYGNIKNAIFDHPMSKDEFEGKLPRLLASISRAISAYPNGIVLDDSGNILREQSIAQAKEKGIQNEYVATLIQQENKEKRIQFMLEAINSKNFDTLRKNQIDGDYAVALAKMFLANNDLEFLNGETFNNSFNPFYSSTYEPVVNEELHNALEKVVEAKLLEKTNKDEESIGPRTIQQIKEDAMDALETYAFFYDSKNPVMIGESVKALGHLKMYYASIFGEAPDAIDQEEMLLKLTKEVAGKKGRTLACDLKSIKEDTIMKEFSNIGEAYKAFVFLEKRKNMVSESDRIKMEEIQKNLLHDNPQLGATVNSLLERDEKGNYRLPEKIVLETCNEMTAKVALSDFAYRSQYYYEYQKGKESPEIKEEYTKYLLGIYKIFREDNKGIVSNDDINFALEFLKELNPEMDLGEKKENGYSNEQAAMEQLAAKFIKKETGREDISPKDANNYLRVRAEVLRDNFSTKIQRTAIEMGKIQDSSKAFQEFLEKSSQELYVDDSIQYINTNNVGKLNSYKTKVLFSSEEQKLYDRVKKTVTVDSWVDSSNVHRLAYLSTMLRISHLRDTGGKAIDVLACEKELRQIEQANPEAVKDLVGHSFDGMTDKKFEEVKNSGDYASRKEDVALYEEALKFNCKKVEARVFEFFESEIFPVNAMSKYKFAAPQEKAQILKYAMLARELANQTSDENTNLKELYNKMSQRALDVLTNGRKTELIKNKETGKTEVDEEALDRAIKERYKLIFGKRAEKGKTSADLFDEYKFDYVQDRVAELANKPHLRDLEGKKQLKPIQEMDKNEREEAAKYYDEYYREIRKYKKLNDKSDMRATTGNKILFELMKPIRNSKLYRRGVQAARAYRDYSFMKATKMCAKYLLRKGSDQKKKIQALFTGEKLALPKEETNAQEGPVIENKLNVYIFNNPQQESAMPKQEMTQHQNQAETEIVQHEDGVKQADSDQETR